jgi:hypothetical protein
MNRFLNDKDGVNGDDLIDTEKGRIRTFNNFFISSWNRQMRNKLPCISYANLGGFFFQNIQEFSKLISCSKLGYKVYPSNTHSINSCWGHSMCPWYRLSMESAVLGPIPSMRRSSSREM